MGERDALAKQLRGRREPRRGGGGQGAAETNGRGVGGQSGRALAEARGQGACGRPATRSAAQDLAGKGSDVREASERDRARSRAGGAGRRGLLGASGGDLSEATMERIARRCTPAPSTPTRGGRRRPRRPRALAAGPVRGRPFAVPAPKRPRRPRPAQGDPIEAQSQAQGQATRPPSAAASARRRPSASARRPRPASASARRPPRASAPQAAADRADKAQRALEQAQEHTAKAAEREEAQAREHEAEQALDAASSSTRSSAADLRVRSSSRAKAMASSKLNPLPSRGGGLPVPGPQRARAARRTSARAWLRPDLRPLGVTVYLGGADKMSRALVAAGHHCNGRQAAQVLERHGSATMAPARQAPRGRHPMRHRSHPVSRAARPRLPLLSIRVYGLEHARDRSSRARSPSRHVRRCQGRASGRPRR